MNNTSKNNTTQSLPLDKRCSCGSVPIIDISSMILLSSLSSLNEEEEESPELLLLQQQQQEKEKLKLACQTHGYFFVKLSKKQISSSSSSNTDNDKLNVFLDESNDTNNIITHLFKERAKEEEEDNNGSSSRSGGNNKTGVRTYMTEYGDEILYRSPMSESGNPNSSSYEPKQSFELFRCSSSSTNNSQEEETTVTPKNPVDWNIIREWIEALHTLSIIVSQTLLQLPNDFIVSTSCTCCPSKNKTFTTNQRCNLDLLRIFRYDSIQNPPTSNCNNAESSIPILGSSSHTDWGAFTIIWQPNTTTTPNNKSLQTYCYKHEIWNNVIHPANNNSNTDVINNNYYEYFLVHTGDFTSLASQSYYTSPRHRVCCSSNTRNSLVYFCYPHSDLTLNMAQQQLQMCQKQSNSNLEMYSLLQNQSSSNNHNENLIKYWNKIRELPFGTVIDDKWAQVQRKD